MDSLTLSLCTILAIVALSSFIIVKQQINYEQQRKEWSLERKDLLDRIQAPTFQEYTNKVVREKKADQPKEEVETIHFVT